MAAEISTPTASHRQMLCSSSLPWAIISEIVRTTRSPAPAWSSLPPSSSSASASSAGTSSFIASTHQPPATPVTAAAATLNRANGQPRKLALTRIESTPVCGVLMRKPIAEPLLAPVRRRPMPAGITPHEQRGSGTPRTTAFSVPP